MPAGLSLVHNRITVAAVGRRFPVDNPGGIMPFAPLPPNEPTHLVALESLQVLDTPSEERFDRITRLASYAFDVPIAVVSVANIHHQQSTSRLGSDITENSHHLAFWTHALSSTATFVIPDAALDVRFAGNALVPGTPNIRFYAAEPLRNADGHNIGTLSIIDYRPRYLTEAELQAFRDLAVLAAREVHSIEAVRAQAEGEPAEVAFHQVVREKHQLTVAIDSLMSGVSITDATQPDNPIVFVNPSFTRMTGYSAAEVIGRNCRFMQGPETDPTAVQALREAINSRQPFTQELLNYRKDGTPFWNELTINPVFDAEGRLINFVGLQNDITERKRVELKMRHLASFPEQNPNTLVEVDFQGQLGYCNPAALRHFPDIIALGLRHPLLENFATVLAALQANPAQPVCRELVLGSVFYEQTITVCAESKLLRFFCHDITTQKQAEAERVRLQEAVIEAQELALQELSTPLIPISDQVVVMPLIGAMDTRRAQQMQSNLLDQLQATRATVAILDLTGVPVVDTQVANALIQAAQAVRLLGAQVILTGIRPELAQTMVGLGIDLRGIVTYSSLQTGIAEAVSRRRS